MQAVSMRTGSFEKRWSPGLATTPSAPPVRRMSSPAIFTRNSTLGQGGGATATKTVVDGLADIALIAAGFGVVSTVEDKYPPAGKSLR